MDITYCIVKQDIVLSGDGNATTIFKEAWRKTSAKLNSGIIHSIHSSVHISRERILKTIKQQLFFFLDEQFYLDQYAIGSK